MTRLIPILGNLDDLAEAIADPNPRRPFEFAVGNFGRQTCDRISARPPGTLGPVLATVADLCGPYWAEQGYSPPDSEVPFTGGQCPGSLYNVSGVRTVGEFAPVTVSAANQLGPIGAFFQVIEGTTSRIFITRGLPGGGGSETVLINESGIGNNTSTFGQVEVVRVSGPDDCGDPPPVPIPGPTPAPDPGPLPPGSGITINVDGSPVFNLPESIDLSPQIEAAITAGDLSFGGSGGGMAVLDAAPTASPEVSGAGDGQGGFDDLFGEPPLGERWVGCCVRLTATTGSQPPIPGSAPEDVYPSVVGNARLLFASGLGRSADTPVQIRSKGVCVWEPVRGLRPVGVFINLIPGYSYSYTPYSVPEDDAASV